MDFELLSESPAKTPGLLQLFERLMTFRVRQWQLWAEKPPRKLGGLILACVTAEFTLIHQLFQKNGINVNFPMQFSGILILIVLAELLFAYTASRMAVLLGKQGNFLTLMIFLNLSLIPFFVVLPAALLVWVGGKGTIALFLGALFLATKVLSYWKEAIELIYKFSKIQSILVMYGAVGLAIASFTLFGYLAFLSHIAKLLS